MKTIGDSEGGGCLACVVLLSFLVLAGCGGSGGGSSSGSGSGGGGSNTAPIADAGATQTVATNALVTLDGSASSDADGDALTYYWTLTYAPVGSNAGLTGATTARPTFTPDVLGTYVVTLVVNDGKASSAAAAIPIVVNGYVMVPGGCVFDTATNLLWEAKTASPLIDPYRHWNNAYTNFDSTASPQKYDFAVRGYVVPTQADIDAPTNTIGFVNAVNAARLCGYGDWRLPTEVELQSLVRHDNQYLWIDRTWFPNTQTYAYWTSTPDLYSTYIAAVVYFSSGLVDGARGDRYHVRLVRTGL